MPVGLSLLLAILCHTNHRRTQQAVLDAVSALQFIYDVVIRDGVALDHMNCLMEVGIEFLACG